MRHILSLLALNGLLITATAGEPEEVPPLLLSRCVDATLPEMWEAWTTESGVRSFFSSGSIVDPRIDGEYSVLFFPESPAGARGAEGMRIVAFEPPQRFVITWNQPPHLGRIREQRALVEFRFHARPDCGTEVRIKHFGWGQGADWTRAREYFAGAWVTVLNRLDHRFEHGPLDWDNVPAHLWYRGPRND